MERPLCAHTYVEQPFDEMALLLIQDPRSILQAATDSAAAEACELRSALRVEVGPFEIGRDITVELGEFRPSSMLRVSIPIRWHATESAGLFPRMSGTLELQALSLDRPLTQLTLVGTYMPPLGIAGAAGDALVGRHVAEVAAERFVHDIAHRIEHRLHTQLSDAV